MSREVQQQVKKLLTDACIVFTDEWFSACVDWVEEENPGVELTVPKLHAEVFAQWLDANLQDMESKCLPPSLAQQECTTLKGKFTLQANCIEDVGTPAYDQINKLKKKDTENASVDADNEGQYKQSWEPKPRRCLCMTLTDGSQEIKAFEATPIPQLNEGLLPGVKVQINGAILCRRGILFLKPGNLRILGGSVDDLLQTNSVMNLLMKRITTTHSQVPQTTGNQRTVTTTNTQPHTATVSATAPVTLAASSNLRMAPPIKVPSSSGASRTQNTTSARGRATHRPSSNRAAHTQPTPIIDDEELLGIDFDDDPFGDDDDAFMDIDEEALINPAVAPVASSSSCHSAGRHLAKKPAIVPATDFQFDDTIELFDISDDFHEKSTIPVRTNPSGSSASMQSVTPRSTSKRPYQFIKWVNENLRNYKGAIAYVKACVSTLTTNVGMKGKMWHLTVNINDGTGFMVVDVCPQLLEKLMGYTATEMKRLILTGTPSAAATKNEAAAKLRKTLVNMNGIFAVQIGDPRCVIKAYEPINLRHARQLSDRLAVRS